MNCVYTQFNENPELLLSVLDRIESLGYQTEIVDAYEFHISKDRNHIISEELLGGDMSNVIFTGNKSRRKNGEY